ncbi:MAG: PQQ-dependent sugar dehydrogenase [Planctomycetota bacterium]
MTTRSTRTLVAATAVWASMWISHTSPADAGGTPLTAVRVAQGVTGAVLVTAPPDDFGRLFIVQQGGTIRILNLVTGQLLPTPFLNIASQIVSGGEQGLLGLAFHPDFATNGFFFVSFTNSSGSSVIRRYTVSTTNPNVADTSTAFPIILQSQPASNHNGGMIAFGPDGYLYFGLGDGGGGNDSFNTSQNTGTRLAKMLRLDVDGPDAFPASANDNFAIPATNPFVGPGNPLDEIWAIGLRNPWRWSFDRLTGDLWIADVGQGAWEEIDFQPAASLGGENYGWRCMEGNVCTGLGACTCFSAALTGPIHVYSHSLGCSVSGGNVYRGMAIPDLDGTYFFADFCTARIWSLRYDGTSVSAFEERTSELDPPGTITIGSIAGFGEDAMGEVYICDLGGEVFKIVPANIASLDCNDNFIVDSIEFALGLALDCDANGMLDVCEIDAGTAIDCDDNGLIDSCEFAAGTASDCNANGLIDSCEIDAGTAIDCDANGLIDACEFAAGTAPDCNANGLIDACEIAAGTAIDCDANGLIDTCEFAAGTASDCNANGVIDACDIAAGTETDCNANGLVDDCELLAGTAVDCNANGVIDSCDVANGVLDCNLNEVPDECELAAGTDFDCNGNGLLDSCDLAFFFEFDCNLNLIPDSCELTAGTVPDCNANNVPDSCDIAAGTSMDVELNGIPDECEAAQFVRGDCNGDASVNVADAIFLLSFLFGSTGGVLACADACDINDDGGLDVADPISELSGLFGGGPLPPAPHPGCGPDPTNENLECDVFSGCP